MMANHRIRAKAIVIAMAVTASLAVLATPAQAVPQLGVKMVADILPGTGSGLPTNNTIVNVNGTAFFRATTTASGAELWKSDGTAAGTVMVKDINPGPGSGVTTLIATNPHNFAVANGMLFFRADDGISGAELWKSDGTEAGTVRVADIQAGSGGSGPALHTAVGSTVFFQASNGTSTELWKTDGTEAGTAMVKDINPASSSSPLSSTSTLVAFNGELFFRANDGISGTELWKSDGTAAGTAMLIDINPGPANADPAGFTLVTGPNKLFFTAIDPTNGGEPWVTDGTAAGTVLLADIRPGTPTSSAFSAASFNGGVYFNAGNGVDGSELYKTDGTPAGTVVVTNEAGSGFSPQRLAAVGSTLYFTSPPPGGTNPLEFELWKSDGTTAGTGFVKDIGPGTASGGVNNITNVNGTAFFTASDGVLGLDVWTTNGTAAGTVQVADINPGSASAAPALLVNVNGTLFFSATNGTTANGTELWRANLNDAPAATTDAYSTNEDTALAPVAPGVLANDTDANGDAMTAVLVTGPAHGSLTLNANGSFSYTPVADYNGPDSFTYKVRDGYFSTAGVVESNVATVNITVTSVNDNPTAVNDSYSTNQNTSLTVAAPGVMGNDSDGDGGTLSAGSPSLPANGAVALNANGSFTYTPNAGFSGADSFTYVLSDGQGGTATGTVNITVTAPAISASPSPVAAGSPVTATWSGIASPTGTDWVGLYASSSTPDPDLLAWAYTGGAAAGSVPLTVPLNAAGGSTYELRLFANNTYTRLATSAPFTVAASATALSASPSSVNAGAPVTATWSGIAAPTATDWVGLYDSASAPDAALLAWAYTGGSAGGNLNLTVPLGATAGSAYELRLFSANTYTRLATSAPFAVVASNPTIAASPASVAAGTPVTATWSGIPAPSATDWVGLYASSGDADSAIVAWAYTDGNAAGASPLTVPAGATPGSTYELRLFSNNTYNRLATSGTFTVTAAGPPATVSSSVATVARGNPLTATWSGIASPTATDWVGLYATGTDPDSAIVAWAYTGGAPAGSVNLVVPLSAPTGSTYELRLYSNNTYIRLATSSPPFTVT